VNAIKRLPTLFIPHGGGPCFFMDPPAADPRSDRGRRSFGESIGGKQISGFQFG